MPAETELEEVVRFTANLQELLQRNAEQAAGLVMMAILEHHRLTDITICQYPYFKSATEISCDVKVFVNGQQFKTKGQG